MTQSAAEPQEPMLSVTGHGYLFEVGTDGLRVERLYADHDCVLVVPLDEIPALSEVVDRAFAAGKEAGLWAG